MSLTKAQMELRSQNKCVDCGGKVERPDKYIRCDKCRSIRREEETQYKFECHMPTPEEVEKMRRDVDAILERRRNTKEFEEQQLQFIRCKKCQWITFTGSGWYCPLPYCWEG